MTAKEQMTDLIARLKAASEGSAELGALRLLSFEQYADEIWITVESTMDGERFEIKYFRDPTRLLDVAQAGARTIDPNSYGRDSEAWNAARRAIKQWEHQGPTHGCLTASVAQGIAQAVARERERCAAVADTEPDMPGVPPRSAIKAMRADPAEFMRATCCATRKNIAKRIRKP